MADPRWVVNDEGQIVYVGLADDEHITAEADGFALVESMDAAEAALVQCVRDADTLAQARDLARTVAAFAEPMKPGSPLGALLDLLIGDQP